MPAMPTVAVQVNVDIPAVTVNVQAGGVAVSVSTAAVAVSVSVPTPVASPTRGAADAQPQPEQHTTRDARASACCDGGEKQVAPAVTSATTARAPRAALPARPRPVRAAARPVRVRTLPTPPVERKRPRRSAAAKHIPRRTIARRAESTPATPVDPAAATRPVPRPTAEARRAAHELPPVRAAGLSVEHMRDNRLLLQLGLLGALLYLVCLAGWISATTLKRRRA